MGIRRGVHRGDETKQGLIEAANEETLFLDEIGDMPLQHEINPVGSTELKTI